MDARIRISCITWETPCFIRAVRTLGPSITPFTAQVVAASKPGTAFVRYTRESVQ